MINQVKSGMQWNLISQILKFLIEFIISTILARLLFPEDFGIVAIILVLSNLVNIFIDSGFRSAIVQQKEIGDVDYSTVFWYNLFVSIIFSVFIFLIAPYVALYYQEPLINPCLKVFIIVIVLNALTLVQESKLTKNLDFRKAALIQISSLVISGVVGICLAFIGFGVWSLIYRSLVFAFLTLFFYYSYNNWMPTMIFNWSSLTKLRAFSIYMLLNKLLQEFASRIDELIIAKIFDKTSLGLYNRSKNLNQLPSTIISQVINKTLFPIFSIYQNDYDVLFINYMKISRLIAFVVVPLFGLLFIVSNEFIVLLYTEKWSGAVEYFQYFCLGGFLWPIISLNVTLLNSIGKNKLQFYSNLFFAILKFSSIFIIFVFKFISIINFIYIYLITFYMEYFVSLFIVSKCINRPIYISLKHLIYPICVSVLLIIIFEMKINDFLCSNLYSSLIIKFFYFTSLYIFFAYLFYKEPIQQLKFHLFKSLKS